ncbi:MAG TPA: MFS transporter, partial [Actinomycetales bacterium]
SLAVQGAAISGVILTRLLPDLVLGPLAGALADRLDRRTTVVVGELLALTLYLSIAVTYELTWLYVAQFLVEAVGLFTNPAKQAMWVSIVPRERLAVANQVSLFSVYGAVPVAALLFALLSTVSRLLGEGDGSEARTAIVVALVVNAGSFGLSAATVLFSRRLIPGTPVDRDGAQRNVFSLVVEGVAFLRGQPFMRALYVGVIGAFGAGGLTVGVAQLYVATLRAGAAGYSVVFGVVFTGLAIGMLAGPRILPTVPRRSVFTHAIGLAGIALLVMSVLRDFVLATAAAFCVGLFAGVSWIIGYTLIGFEVEDRLRGRVFAFVISSVRIVLLLAVAVGPGLALGMLVGPKILPTIPRRTLFARSIGLAGIALLAMSLLQDFVLATGAAFLVGLFAGISWIIGYTLIGFEVEDRLRGRVFAFVVSSVRIVLLLAVAVGPGLAGVLGTHDLRVGELMLTLTGPGLTLMIGGALALLVSAYAVRQVVPRGRPGTRARDVFRLLWGSSDILSASASATGLFLVVEGADRELTRRYTEALADVVRDRGCSVVVTSEPSDTDLGRRVGRLLYPPRPAPTSHEPGWPAPAPRRAGPGDGDGPRVEAYTAALLAAADRAEHVATVIRPA